MRSVALFLLSAIMLATSSVSMADTNAIKAYERLAPNVRDFIAGYYAISDAGEETFNSVLSSDGFKFIYVNSQCIAFKN